MFLEQEIEIKLDLFSLNLQRGRDHGLLDYNSIRSALGLQSYTQFSDITNDVDTVDRLSTTYVELGNIDPWVGILCETPNSDGVLGEVGSTIVGTTFRDIRAGDRFWYENYMSRKAIDRIKQTTLNDIILRNTDLTELPNSQTVFVLNPNDY